MNDRDIVKIEYGTLLTIIDFINNKVCYSELDILLDGIQDEINNIELTPGPPGPKGDSGSIEVIEFSKCGEDKANKKIFFCSSKQIPLNTSSTYIIKIMYGQTGSDSSSSVILKSNNTEIPILDYYGSPMKGNHISKEVPFIAFYQKTNNTMYLLNMKLY